MNRAKILVLPNNKYIRGLTSNEESNISGILPYRQYLFCADSWTSRYNYSVDSDVTYSLKLDPNSIIINNSLRIKLALPDEDVTASLTTRSYNDFIRGTIKVYYNGTIQHPIIDYTVTFVDNNIYSIEFTNYIIDIGRDRILVTVN